MCAISTFSLEGDKGGTSVVVVVVDIVVVDGVVIIVGVVIVVATATVVAPAASVESGTGVAVVCCVVVFVVGTERGNHL